MAEKGDAGAGLPDAEELRRSGDYVRALERGFAVVRSFTAEPSGQSLAEVADRTGLNRATARRFLYTLHALGYIDYDDGRYSLSPKIMELGYTYMSGLDLPELARPTMVELSRTVAAPVSLGILAGGDTVIVGRAEGPRIAELNVRIGSRLPAYAAAPGMILLANLEPDRLEHYLATTPRERLTARTLAGEDELRAALKRCREEGVAIDDQGLELGGRGIAVPVDDRRGRTVAALNIGVQVSRMTIDQMREQLLPLLVDARDAIERLLALSPDDRGPDPAPARSALA